MKTWANSLIPVDPSLFLSPFIIGTAVEKSNNEYKGWAVLQHEVLQYPESSIGWLPCPVIIDSHVLLPFSLLEGRVRVFSITLPRAPVQSLRTNRHSTDSLLRCYRGKGRCCWHRVRPDLHSQGSSIWGSEIKRGQMPSYLSWVVIFSFSWPSSRTAPALAYVKIIDLDGQKIIKQGSISIKGDFICHGVFESLERKEAIVK